MNIRKILSVLLVALMIAGLFAGCGASSNEAADMGYSDNGGYLTKDEIEIEEPAAGITEEGTQGSTAAPVNQKLIRTVNIDAETEDLDELLTQVGKRISELGGYIEEQSVYNGSSYNTRRYRSANMTIRIPADRLDEFIDHVTGASNIISKNETAKDITLTYVATQSRVTALQTEEERLLELLSKAENMEDLLQIEQRLTDVRTELEQVYSQLRLYDNQVNYGTVLLYVDEVVDYTVVQEPEGFFARIGTGFMSSLKNIGIWLREFVIGLISAIPYLIIPGVLAVIIVIALKRKKNKKTPPAKTEG